MIKLVPNIRAKMRAYSIWSLMLSLALFLLPEFWLAHTGQHLASPYTVGKLALFFGVFGLVGWFIDQRQPDLLRTLILAGVSALISILIWALMVLPVAAMDRVQPGLAAEHPPVSDGLPTWAQTSVHAIPLVVTWEGTGPTFACRESPRGICVRAYMDTIAEPDLPTICYGQTSNTGVTVRIGDTRTIEECEAGLNSIMRDQYWAAWRAHLTLDRLHPKTDAAMTSLTWNIGVGAFTRSTALRRLNAGDVAGACEALTYWNKAGGAFSRGLYNRRSAEYALCMAGVA